MAFMAVCLLLPATKPMIEQSMVQFIIDPGHGLPDGGAVGLDGTTEQMLNLQIGTAVYQLFDQGKAIISRSSEQGLSVVKGSIREHKISDMKQRVELAKRYPQALLISVHMNTYPNSSVYGCQVFYKDNDPKSLSIAQRLQQNINEQLQPDHTKNCKPISDSLYLFKNTDNSAILIECGFLTNQEELLKLKDEEYQRKLARLIYEAVQQ